MISLQVTHSRKLYEALQSEKCTIEEENSGLLQTNTTLKEEHRTMELELVVAKKDVSLFSLRINSGALFAQSSGCTYCVSASARELFFFVLLSYKYSTFILVTRYSVYIESLY